MNDTFAIEPLHVAALESEEVIRVLYRQFRPFTKINGPLFAGKLTVDGNPGHVYLTEGQDWLWLNKDDCPCSVQQLGHAEIDRLTTPLVESKLPDSLSRWHNLQWIVIHRLIAFMGRRQVVRTGRSAL